MIEFAVGLTTAGVIGAATAGGHAAGGRRLARTLRSRALPVSVGLAVLWGGISWRWFWPLGLVTPAVVGVAAACGVRLMLRPVRGGESRGNLARGDRRLGAAMGAVGGALGAALLWTTASIATAAWSANDVARQSEPSWWGGLVQTAHRGFVRHLPVIGPLSDELEALVFVLNVDSAAQQRLAASHQWTELATLPEMAEVLCDREVMTLIERARDGDVMAFYHLQNNAKVMALLDSAEISRAVVGLRPSALADELRSGPAVARVR